MSDDNADGPVYSFGKNAIERVHADTTRYKGHSLIDVRIYYQDDDGAWKPSRKGLTLNVDLLPELEAAVAALRKAVGDDDALSN